YSYNRMLDLVESVNLIDYFDKETRTVAILKRNNACVLVRSVSLVQAYRDALAGDPLSAFGGILISNMKIDEDTAAEIHKLFCEVVIAPGFSNAALTILKGKKNRILLRQKSEVTTDQLIRSCLNGILVTV